MINNESVDAYLAIGCGRCALFRTPQCKVHTWARELVALRALLNASELDETMKWGSPCYTLDGANVAMIVAFNDWCGLSFFKGVLLEDPDGLLDVPGPATHAGRVLKLHSVDELEARRAAMQGFVQQAIALERAGATVPERPRDEPMPDELQAMLDGNPVVAEAFQALTPGRQRSYVLHVGGAKQAKTRVSRAEKCIPKILAGKGFNER